MLPRPWGRRSVVPCRASPDAKFQRMAFASRYDWRERVVLLSGASRGLGLLLARRFGRLGAHPVLVARHDAELDRAARMLAHEGIDAHTIVADVADPEQAARAVEETLARHGKIDGLVNAASIISVAPFAALSRADLEAAVDVNFWGTVHMTWSALPHLRRVPGARIVNISSIGGLIPVPHLMPYVCGKFAVTGFSLGLQTEVAKEGVRVVSVFPGLMRTGSDRHALVKGRRRKEAALFRIAASLPFVTMDAGRAADRIVRATARGERFVVVGLPAKLGRLAFALAPGFTTTLLGLVSRALPDAPGGSAAQPPSEAAEHPSTWTRSPLTLLGRRASHHNNERFMSPFVPRAPDGA